MRYFRMISRKGVVTDEMSLLPTHRHEGNRPLERLMKVIDIRRRRECINCGRRFTYL